MYWNNVVVNWKESKYLICYEHHPKKQGNVCRLPCSKGCYYRPNTYRIVMSFQNISTTQFWTYFWCTCTLPATNMGLSTENFVWAFQRCSEIIGQCIWSLPQRQLKFSKQSWQPPEMRCTFFFGQFIFTPLLITPIPREGWMWYNSKI